MNVCFNIIKSSVSGNIYKTSERKKTFWYFPFIIVRLIWLHRVRTSLRTDGGHQFTVIELNHLLACSWHICTCSSLLCVLRAVKVWSPPKNPRRDPQTRTGNAPNYHKKESLCVCVCTLNSMHADKASSRSLTGCGLSFILPGSERRGRGTPC